MAAFCVEVAMGSFVTINPATNQVIKSYDHLAWGDAERALLRAEKDFQVWRKVSISERSAILLKLAASLRDHKNELAQMMNLEMGKLFLEGIGEVEKCAVTCEFYAKEAAAMLRNQVVPASPYTHAEVSFQPLGVIFSIMPWNFPIWQVIRFVAPALMAGNTILLKHADMTAGTAEMLEKVFIGLTSEYQLLRNVQLDHEGAARLIAQPLVRGVTFTGSSQGGRAVAIEAAKSLKKVVLELGGSDAYLILDDADVALAAQACAQTRLVNCGQSCVAGKRFIVTEKIAQDFIVQFVDAMRNAPLAPLASVKFQTQIMNQVEKLKSWGGSVALGGVLPQGEGAFYPATVVVFKTNRPEIHAEEVFGPVAIVIVVKDSQEAVEVANSSPFGLGGGVFTQDLKKGYDLIEKELQAGFVVVNDFVKSDPRIPFGGIKESGYGRELGHYGILEFVNIKTVAMAGDRRWN